VVDTGAFRVWVRVAARGDGVVPFMGSSLLRPG